jgi:protein-S-isoprenylcysteine O-methyltransferase Ste14
MSLVPEFQIGLWNGWILTVTLRLVNLGVMALVSKETRKRLFALPPLEGIVKVAYLIQMVLNHGIMVYSIFVPLKLHTAWLPIGLVVFGLGMIGTLVAVSNFASTPPGQPVVKGLYRISRNPIQVISFVATLGVGIATASWVIIVANIVEYVVIHITTLAEERFCLDKYGESYRAYMKRVPRYFLFF